MESAYPLPPIPVTNGVMLVDNSGWIEPLSTCDRYAEYRQLHNRIPAGDRSPLRFGGAVHEVLEYRYKKYGSGPLDGVLGWDSQIILGKAFEGVEIPEGDFRTLNWCDNVLLKYHDRYPQEEFAILEYETPIECNRCGGSGYTKDIINPLTMEQEMEKCMFCFNGKVKRMVEISFAIPLCEIKLSCQVRETTTGEIKSVDSVPVVYCGKIDLCLSQDNQNWVLDHKTTSMLGGQFWDTMRMTSQMRGYCWAFQRSTGLPIQGYIVNAIRTKEPPQYITFGKSRGAQNPETWWGESFARERFHLKEGELDEWENNTIALIKQFAHNYSQGYMPKKTQWCSSYGKCAYYDVCSLEQSSRLGMLNSGAYIENKWSPLNPVAHEKPVETKHVL